MPASCAAADGSQDAVLLFGPLYHLTEAADRQRALAEATRVLRPDGRAARDGGLPIRFTAGRAVRGLAR